MNTCYFKKLKIELRRKEVKIFKGTYSKVIDLKLDGSSVASSLWINIVGAFFHLDGTLPVAQTLCIILVRNDRNVGKGNV